MKVEKLPVSIGVSNAAPMVVGFCGCAGAGKFTAADVLAEFGYFPHELCSAA